MKRTRRTWKIKGHMGNAKALILNIIKEKRDILFGKYSETVTQQLKKDTWTDIYKQGCSMGILNPDKGWRFFRDSVWQNWRKRAITRVHNSEDTLTADAHRLDEMDMTVLDIIGPTDSALKREPTIPLTDALDTESDSQYTNETLYPRITGVFHQPDSEFQTKEYLEMSILKAKLDLLERDVYLKDLEIYKRERELSLPTSEFTSKIYSHEIDSKGPDWCFNHPGGQCKIETNV